MFHVKHPLVIKSALVQWMFHVKHYFFILIIKQRTFEWHDTVHKDFLIEEGIWSY